MPPSNPIPLEGVLNCWTGDYDLPDLLLFVSRSGKTGRLSFSNAEGDKVLYIKEGKIIFAESSSDDDSLGQHLLRSGKISLQDYTRVSKLVEPGKRLGALLVAEGVLEPRDLVPAVVGQVRAIIVGLFRRTETWYGFKEEELPRKEAITLDMPVAQLILDGVQLVDSWRRVSKGVGDLETECRLVKDSEAEWTRLKLEPGVVDLLSRLESPSRPAEVCTQAMIPDFDACRYLWAFRALGWIETAGLSEEVAAEVTTETPAAEPPAEIQAELPAESPAELAAEPHVEPQEELPQPEFPTELQTQLQSEFRTELAADDLAAQLAAESSHSAEVDYFSYGDPFDPIPAASAAAAPAADQSTVMHVGGPAPAIPQRLIETRVAGAGGPVNQAEPLAPPPPRPTPEALARTRLDLTPPPTPPELAVTSPSIDPKPRAIANELHHTQLYLDSLPDSSEPAKEPDPPSAGDMMEKILQGSDDGSEVNYDRIESAPLDLGSEDATQFFLAPSTLESLPSVEAPVEDFFQGSQEFASLSLNYDAPVTVPAPEAPAEPDAAEPSAFQDLSISDEAVAYAALEADSDSVPLIEATVVEAGDESATGYTVVEATSLPPELIVTQPSIASGMERLAANDPFSAPDAASVHPPDQPVSASVPGRSPKTGELDLDMDFFGGDEGQ